MSAGRYPIPAARTRVENEIKHSRFITTIAHAPTVEAARAFVDEIRDEFPDATHNCWAYVIGAPGTTHANASGDDGEPGGTAGRPMLTALLGSDVGDIAAVVTRYFGGVKLGRGGLVRAYGGGVQHALREMPRGEHVERVALVVHAHYASVETVRRIMAEHDAEPAAETFEEEVRFEVLVPSDRAAGFTREIVDATSGTARVDDA